MGKKSHTKGDDIIEKKNRKENKSGNFNRNNGQDVINEQKKMTYKGFAKKQLLDVLRLMLRARTIDNKSMNLLRQGKTFFHIAGSGHEAVQAAISLFLDKEKDWFFPYYRDLTIALAIGLTPKEFFLQCFAKADDPSGGGKQLPEHWGLSRINLPAQSSPTGTQYLQAVGAALASVKTGKKYITYVSSGEGTTSEGEFHEAVNWASREKLPVLFLVENNNYAISVHVKHQSGGKDHSIAEMMGGYANLYRDVIDGTDFFESCNKLKEAINYIKSGNGPALVEAEVVRLSSHSSSDDQKKYRNEKELIRESEKDPIEQFVNILTAEGILSREEYETIKQEIINEINEASDEAKKAKDPDPKEANRFIFDESGLKESFEYEKSESEGSKVVMVDAINHALHEEAELNKKIYIFGQDIADKKGGVFTATKGLSTKFGNDRVFNSPLAEASIIGVATGMALTGLKPVVEIQFGDYIWPGFMQIKDELSTIRYRSNNNWSAPVVIRVAVGGYIHGGLYHSQNIESIFAHIPGIYIVYPSNAADAKGLLKTACRLNDPVLFCEHKGLYRASSAQSPEPGKDYLLPFGKAKIVRSGEDITVVSYGISLWDSIIAARKLEDEGYSVEVIDIRTIVPLDEETIFNSVRKTNKVIVIHEDTITAGFGAEISARIADSCFQHLDAPVKRIGAKDSHIPYSPILENVILPSREDIYRGIKELIEW
jgi:2-oxoisovalerate dehydrogenase E1 component